MRKSNLMAEKLSFVDWRRFAHFKQDETVLAHAWQRFQD
jgi:hypothetical protein